MVPDSASQGRRGESRPTVAAGRQADAAVEQFLAEVVETQTQPQREGVDEGLRGSAAIVTGGATGIGRAIVLELARNGVHIAFNYLDDGDGRIEEEAGRVTEELRQLEVKVLCRSCDVRDRTLVESFVQEAVDTIGGVHILVNNAGIARDRALWRMTDEDWQEVLDTNLTGCFNMIRCVSPIMREQQSGKIVNVSSIHGIRSEFGLSNYAASKAGILGLTRSAAVELGPSNINVNAVAPGYIRTTRLTAGVPSEVLDRAREHTVLGRLGGPQDVANVVVFLCSERAQHITGAVIPVDGGHLL